MLRQLGPPGVVMPAHGGATRSHHRDCEGAVTCLAVLGPFGVANVRLQLRNAVLLHPVDRFLAGAVVTPAGDRHQYCRRHNVVAASCLLRRSIESEVRTATVKELTAAQIGTVRWRRVGTTDRSAPGRPF
jgi:hypothetical protein